MVVLIDSHRSVHLYHSCGLGRTFSQYSNWYWKYDQPKGKIGTYSDCLYIGVL